MLSLMKLSHLFIPLMTLLNVMSKTPLAQAAGFMDYFKKASVPSKYMKANPDDPFDYGVDVSFPIHSMQIDPDSFQGKRYQHSMDTCAARYSESECGASERARVAMNRDQPRAQHNYTELGFKKLRLPDDVFAKLLDFYEVNKEKAHPENWPRGNTYCNHWDSPTFMISTEDSNLRGVGTAFKNKIWEGVRPIIEEWTGHKQKPTSLYGIRVYHQGAILATHVDRLPLVSSCIIQVAQDINEPWPIEVYDHAGKAHNVTMLPGEMVLYESHTVLHGRPTPLNGSFYANVFVHFEPIDHSEMNGQDKKNRNAVKSGRRKIGGHEADNHDDEELAFHKAEHERDASQQNLKVVSSNEEEEEDEEEKEEEEQEEGEEEEVQGGRPVPLNDAAASGDLIAVKAILHDHPEMINLADENGWQPIHEAVRGGHLDIVKLLIENGSDISAQTLHGGTPLWWARRTLDQGHSVIEYLEEIGAPDDKDE